MVEVAVRVDHLNGLIGELTDNGLYVANAISGIQEHRSLRADYQIGNDLLPLKRLIDRPDAGFDFVDLKPVVTRRVLLILGISRTWEAVTEGLQIRSACIRIGPFGGPVSCIHAAKQGAEAQACHQNIFHDAIQFQVAATGQHRPSGAPAISLHESRILAKLRALNGGNTIPNTEAGSTIRKIIEEMAKLNADHEYSYSDDELIQMLKEARLRSERGANSGERRLPAGSTDR
jgi:hypothetical protein